MTEAAGSNWMAGYAANFRTVNTVTPVAPAGVQLLLGADPRRWYVEFGGFVGGTTNPKVWPGPIPPEVTGISTALAVQSYTFKDAPAAVVGEWYGFNDGTVRWTILEQLFVG